MIEKIDELFDIKLSKKGKEMINKWVEEEIKQNPNFRIDTDDNILNFVKRMLVKKKVRLSDLCKYSEK